MKKPLCNKCKRGKDYNERYKITFCGWSRRVIKVKYKCRAYIK